MSGPPGPSKPPEKPFSAEIDVPQSRARSGPPRTLELAGRLVLLSSGVVRLGSGPGAPPEARPGTPKGSPGHHGKSGLPTLECFRDAGEQR